MIERHIQQLIVTDQSMGRCRLAGAASQGCRAKLQQFLLLGAVPGRTEGKLLLDDESREYQHGMSVPDHDQLCVRCSLLGLSLEASGSSIRQIYTPTRRFRQEMTGQVTNDAIEVSCARSSALYTPHQELTLALFSRSSGLFIFSLCSVCLQITEIGLSISD